MRSVIFAMADKEIVFDETQAENVSRYKIRAEQLCGKKR